ncbi:hypothetical protein B0F90DRAFT_1710491 [Multifurca ochricompacta]|uniref:Uncharacterized protein n=1 Tax=Multifurca ochricompacta TaxID=376703 RepID=A0AAD4QNA8_9AGAM|nr:hypothetical protein B0F90DRAFT_1710491 [Multifurca ochricompacta]
MFEDGRNCSRIRGDGGWAEIHRIPTPCNDLTQHRLLKINFASLPYTVITMKVKVQFIWHRSIIVFYHIIVHSIARSASRHRPEAQNNHSQIQRRQRWADTVSNRETLASPSSPSLIPSPGLTSPQSRPPDALTRSCAETAETWLCDAKVSDGLKVYRDRLERFLRECSQAQ